MTSLLAIFAASLACCLVLTPLVRSLASRHGLVDRPDGRRKLQEKAVPLGGGLAVLASAAAGAVAAVCSRPLHGELAAEASKAVGLGIAALAIAAVGLADDARGLRGRHKLLGQVAAVAIVVSCGVVVRTVCFFGIDLNLGLLSIPFTVFLLLGTINSLNLLDGADGLLSCIGLVTCVALAAIAAQLANWPAACMAAALAGALAGFLRYNFPPASIFMGDCGSMVVGLAIGVVAIEGSLKGPATVALTAPLTLLTLPVFDTLAAIVRRKLTGRSIYAPDRSHLHHCLLRSGRTVRGMLRLVAALSLLTFFGAVASVAWRAEWVALVCALAVVHILVATRLFGRVEVELLKKHLAARLFHGAAHGGPNLLEVRIQGSADWPSLWHNLTIWADTLNLQSLRMDINVPALHEAFLGRWEREDRWVEDHNLWRAEIPLMAGGHTLGRLEIIGQREEGSSTSKIAVLARLVEDLEFAAGATAGVLPLLPSSMSAAGRPRRVAEGEALAGCAADGYVAFYEGNHDGNRQKQPSGSSPLAPPKKPK